MNCLRLLNSRWDPDILNFGSRDQKHLDTADWVSSNWVTASPQSCPSFHTNVNSRRSSLAGCWVELCSPYPHPGNRSKRWHPVPKSRPGGHHGWSPVRESEALPVVPLLSTLNSAKLVALSSCPSPPSAPPFCPALFYPPCHGYHFNYTIVNTYNSLSANLWPWSHLIIYPLHPHLRRALRVAGIKHVTNRLLPGLTGLYPQPGCSLLSYPSILPIPALWISQLPCSLFSGR